METKAIPADIKIKKPCGCSCGCHSHTSNSNDHEHSGHEHTAHEDSGLRAFLLPALSLLMLAAGLALSHFGVEPFASSGPLRLGWYILAFLPVGLPVMRESAEGIARGDVFNEFTLMAVACIGAFCIGEYPEAVGVMLFYSVGETIQDRAVNRARRDISRLVGMRGEKIRVVHGGAAAIVDPRDVKPGETIEVRPGERVQLDGSLESREGVFDTSALTGESVPRTVGQGGEVLAGMISSSSQVRIRVSREYGRSTLSRILEMVEEAAEKKAKSELFIRRFARVYTPAVMLLAALLVAVPWIVGLLHPSFHFVFSEWLYRALVFLVISCPCALVISVPLAYFAGIGAASRAGILFKGGNYLDALARVDIVAFDKTGTLTTGRFSVERVESPELDADELLAFMAAAERGSNHPLAVALTDYARGRGIAIPEPGEVREIAGYGTEVTVAGRLVLAGSPRLLRSRGVACPPELDAEGATLIVCAVDGKYVGHAVMADTVKPDAAAAVEELGRLGVRRVVMLSGDRKEAVAAVASRLGIAEAHGELLPADKAAFVREVARGGHPIAFVGDGMNDAPVLALSDVGVAMGGLGSDAAIESADVVVPSDSPSRLATAIRIGRATHGVAVENIVGAVGVKVAVLLLGAFGLASLWAAVFADVGVALLAVANAMRILRERF